MKRLSYMESDIYLNKFFYIILRNVIHGDLALRNCLIDVKNLRVVLTDFGQSCTKPFWHSDIFYLRSSSLHRATASAVPTLVFSSIDVN